MAFAECENGHIYDSALYEKCPYCINKEVRIDFSKTSENIGRTMPLEARTCIEVGGSKFIFVAFCNSQISWH